MTVGKRGALWLAAIVVVAAPILSRTDAGAPFPGSLDLQQAEEMGDTFTQAPASLQPKLSLVQIWAAAANVPGVHRASQIRYQFLLFTTPDGGYTPESIQDDPGLAADLKADGHPVNLPVWIVSLEVLSLPATQGPAVNHEDNLVVDATSGQLLQSFTYR